MACKAYRDYAREEKGIKHPEIVLPITAHSAFDKAGQYFKIKLKTVPLDPTTTQVDMKAMKRAITSNTIMAITRNDATREFCDLFVEISAGRIGAQLPVRNHRRHCGNIVFGRQIQHSGPRRFLPGRLLDRFHAPLRIPGSYMRFLSTRRYQHLRGYTQVRIRAERNVHSFIPRQKVSFALDNKQSNDI